MGQVRSLLICERRVEVDTSTLPTQWRFFMSLNKGEGMVWPIGSSTDRVYRMKIRCQQCGSTSHAGVVSGGGSLNTTTARSGLDPMSAMQSTASAGAVVSHTFILMAFAC